MADKKLTRSSTQKVIGGVCGGIAEYYGWDVTLVRVAFVLAVLLGASGIVLYLLLLLIMPQG
jgi:phage shock protein C